MTESKTAMIFYFLSVFDAEDAEVLLLFFILLLFILFFFDIEPPSPAPAALEVDPSPLNSDVS